MYIYFFRQNFLFTAFLNFNKYTCMYFEASARSWSWSRPLSCTPGQVHVHVCEGSLIGRREWVSVRALPCQSGNAYTSCVSLCHGTVYHIFQWNLVVCVRYVCTYRMYSCIMYMLFFVSLHACGPYSSVSCCIHAYMHWYACMFFVCACMPVCV